MKGKGMSLIFGHLTLPTFCLCPLTESDGSFACVVLQLSSDHGDLG